MDGAKELIKLSGGDGVKRHTCLYKLLIEQRRSVLTVGEGNFTFTLAFAALRKYCWHSNPVKLDDWQGIISTRYECTHEVTTESFQHLFPGTSSFRGIKFDQLQRTPEPSSDDLQRIFGYDFGRDVLLPPDPKVVRQTCLDNVNDKFPKSLLLKEHPTPREILESIPPGEFYCGIDARDIPPHLIPHRGVIWFQCPWDDDPSWLIRSFLLNTAPKLVHEDSYICVGITRHKEYFWRYRLDSILHNEDLEVVKNYEFLGADDDLIYQILGFGYRHQSLTGKDIHDFIRDHHLTLIFRRKLRKPDCQKEI